MQHGVKGDISGILYLAINSSTSLMLHGDGSGEAMQSVAIFMGILGSIVVILDHSMKIHWKIKQYKKEKKKQKHEADSTDDSGPKG